MRATAVERAGVAPASPAYQLTVLRLVPAVSVVAALNGVAGGLATTRIGGLLPKNSLAAWIDDAAASDVAASLPTEVVSAAWRLFAVAVVSAPMVNWLSPGGLDVVAVSVRSSVVPSGSEKVKRTVSPGCGCVPPRSTEIAGGEPAGPVAVAPVRVEATLTSLKPNTDGATSSLMVAALVGAADGAARPKIAGLALPERVIASPVLVALMVMFPVPGPDDTTEALPPASVPSRALSSAMVETSGGAAAPLVPNVTVSGALAPTAMVSVWPLSAGTCVSRLVGSWVPPVMPSVANRPAGLGLVRLTGVSASALVMTS